MKMPGITIKQIMMMIGSFITVAGAIVVIAFWAGGAEAKTDATADSATGLGQQIQRLEVSIKEQQRYSTSQIRSDIGKLDDKVDGISDRVSRLEAKVE